MVNKLQNFTYNNVVDEITVSDGAEKSSYITYLYNHVMGAIGRNA